MMPNMRETLRGFGRRLSVQVLKQKVVDFEADDSRTDFMRASLVMTPMPPRKIVIKPEGQRTWKWWDAISSVKLELGWHLKADKDGRRLYEVMETSDWSQAGIFAYQLAEAPR